MHATRLQVCADGWQNVNDVAPIFQRRDVQQGVSWEVCRVVAAVLVWVSASSHQDLDHLKADRLFRARLVPLSLIRANIKGVGASQVSPQA